MGMGCLGLTHCEKCFEPLGDNECGLCKKCREEINQKVQNTNKIAVKNVLSMLEEKDREIDLSNKVINKRNEEKLELTKRCFEKDKIIDLMAKDIYDFQIECNRYFKDTEEVKQYFENKAKEVE